MCIGCPELELEFLSIFLIAFCAVYFKYWNGKVDVNLAVKPWCKNQNLFFQFESWEEENQSKTLKNCCDIGFLVTD